MTKKVRIENADTSNHKVRVYLEEKNESGEWVRNSSPKELDNPTQLIEEYVHSTRRLVIAGVQ